MSIEASALNPEITCQKRRFVALTDTREIEARVNPHICVYYRVTWDEVDIYLRDIKSDVALGLPKRALNQYLADRLHLKVIAECHGDVFKGHDLSGGDFSEVNGRDLHLDGCNLSDTIWNWAHLERAQFQSNQMLNVSFQHAFLEKSTWTDVVLMGDFSNVRLNGATLTRCTISARLLDRGCVWYGTVWDNPRMEPGLDEAVRKYVDEQRDALQKDFIDLSRRCEENAGALRARHEATCLALQKDMMALEQKQRVSGVAHDFEMTHLKTQYSILSETLEKQQHALGDVVEQVQHLQDDVTGLKEKRLNDPLHDLREKMLAHIDTLFDAAMLPFYVDLNVVSSGTGNSDSLPLWDRLDQFMGNDKESFFLLHGDIGSGKSLSVLRLAQQLAQQYYNADDWFPLYIKLKDMNDLSSDNFFDAALGTIATPEQIKVIKTIPCVIFLDGLDECRIDYSQRPLLEECSDAARQWAKGLPRPKIILTTQTRCLIERNYHQLLRISPGVPFPRQSEYAIQPLNDTQIESYLQSYYPHGMNAAALDKSNVRSLLLLHIYCVVLQANKGSEMLLQSREAYYDAFMHHWSKQVIPKRPKDHFTADSVKKYCRRMAFQMYVEKKSYIDRPYEEEEKEPLQLDEERRRAYLHNDPSTYMFDDTLWKRAGWLAPMSASLLTDRLPWVVRNIFLHKSFQYWSLAHDLIDKICRSSETERLTNWNFSFLTDSFDVFDFLTSITEVHPQKKAILSALKDMVSASATPDGAKWEIAASNAITLLNALRVDFSALLRPGEWRGIHIPRANLKGALLASVDLSNSDLSYVVFENAVLAACNISGSNVEGTRFSDFQLFGITKKAPTFLTVRPTDPWIVTYDGEEDSDSKQHKIVSRGLDGTIYPDFSGHMDKIRTGAWVESDGEARFASGGDGKTVRVQRITEKGVRGEEIAKLKDNAQGIVLSLSWSKNGNILAAAGEYPNIILWNVDKNKCEVVPSVHGGTVRAVLLGQIREIMLSAGDDRIVRLWNVRIKARNLKSISNRPKENQLSSQINALALSVTESEFAAGCSDSNIYLYSTDRDSFENATAHRVLQGHNDVVTSVIWNAWWLVSASNDSTVRVWDIGNMTCVSTFQGDGRPVKQVAWLPGGRQALAGGGGKSRMLFIVDTDVQSSLSPDVEGLTHRVTTTAPHGKYLATGSIDGKVWLWDLKTLPYSAKKILDHEGVPVIQIEWSQAGEYVASRSHRDIRIRECSLTIGSEIDRGNGWGVIPNGRGILFHHMTWLNDLASRQSWLALGGSDGQIHLWKREIATEMDAWVPLLTIPWGTAQAVQSIHCVAAAPSRRSILEAEIPSMSTLSSAQEPSFPVLKSTGTSPVFVDESLNALTPTSDNISTSGGSNSATNVLAASFGALTRIWDLRQEGGAVCVQELHGHVRSITQLMWSPDGRFLASMDEGQAVWVWETSEWASVFKDEQAADEKNMSWAIIGEDKLWLVLGALDEIRIFDALTQFATREPVKTLSWGADKLCYHAGFLFLVQNRSVDMISLVELLFGEWASPFWVGRIGHGLCMLGCIATDVKNISPATKAFIKNLGAVVSEEPTKWSWRFWDRRPTETVAPFPALRKYHDGVSNALSL